MAVEGEPILSLIFAEGYAEMDAADVRKKERDKARLDKEAQVSHGCKCHDCQSRLKSILTQKVLLDGIPKHFRKLRIRHRVKQELWLLGQLALPAESLRHEVRNEREIFAMARLDQSDVQRNAGLRRRKIWDRRSR